MVRMKLNRFAMLWVLVSAAFPAVACSPYIEETPDRTYAIFRPHTDAFEDCTVDEATYHRIITEWLQSRSAELPNITSLSLGRAVYFPWVSQHIADTALQSPHWSERVNSAQRGQRDALATDAIRDPELLARLAIPFEGSMYEVTGISFEKVLYGRADEYSSNKTPDPTWVPFDAQLWLKLAIKNR